MLSMPASRPLPTPSESDSRGSGAVAPVDADVALAAQGDIDAFERLYRANVGRVRAVCLRMCGRADEADEMTQEAFVRAWERLSTFRGGAAFSTWLHRLAVNVVLSSWRARSRRPETLVPAEDLDEPAPPSDGPTRTGDRLDLERAIRALPRGARTVFLLHDVEGWKHREIAERIGTTVGTSKAQLHRARRLLQETLR